MVSEILAFLLDPLHLAIILGVSIFGILLGASPGVGPALTVALAFPFVVFLDPALGLVIVGALYGSTTYGGAVSSILVNVPGTAGSAATLLDGYPMSQKGEAINAISLATLASFFGATVGLLTLILIGPPLARISLMFGPPEIFLVAVYGLIIVILVVEGSLMKSLISVCLGGFFAMVGPERISGQYRYTVDTIYLQAGVDIVIVAIGLFALSQVIELAENKTPISHVENLQGGVRESIEIGLKSKWEFIRSSAIGVGVGAIPGVGLPAANFLAYLVSINRSDDPQSYGKGNPRGVIASEASNNASAMATLIPTFAIGIPGGVVAAIIMGLLTSYGVSPGRGLFEGSLIFIFLGGIFLSNIVFLVVGLTSVRYFTRITTLSSEVVLSGIVVFSLIGAFSLRNNILDVGMAIFFGFLGYYMMKRGYSIIAFIIAFILIPIAEQGYQRSLLISDHTIFVTRPISIVTVALTAITVLTPLVYRVYKYRR